MVQRGGGAQAASHPGAAVAGADPQIAYPQIQAQAIAFVYRHALGRDASAEEIARCAATLALGLPFELFLKSIAESEEAAARSNAHSWQDSISFVYRHALRREPAADELAAWLSAFQRGLPFAQFLASVTASDEADELARADGVDQLEEAIDFAFRHALGRNATAEDVEAWSGWLRQGVSFPRFLRQLRSSEEASLWQSRRAGAELSDGLFIAHLFEAFAERAATVEEIMSWKGRLAAQEYSRSDVMVRFFDEAMNRKRVLDGGLGYDPSSVRIMGTARELSRSVWAARAEELARVPATPLAETTFAGAGLAMPAIRRQGVIRVSAIASLYKGGAYIERFLSNLTSQSLGGDFELIIIDANSPDGEHEVIKRYQKLFPNIRYEHINYRLGVYDAWNVGVGLARGAYLTNTNLDDLRRHDSLELQANTLDRMSFADVVYQDFFYTLDPTLTFDEIAAFGFKSSLPIVNANNILQYNSPHNAPMWRKRLHAEIGLFDTSLKSAGDHDFWMRCLLAGKVFYKINTPHAAYYQNPDGISTRPGTRGLEEGQRILKKYGRKLLSRDVYMDAGPFAARLAEISQIERVRQDGLDFYAETQREFLAVLAAAALPDSRPREP